VETSKGDLTVAQNEQAPSGKSRPWRWLFPLVLCIVAFETGCTMAALEAGALARGALAGTVTRAGIAAGARVGAVEAVGGGALTAEVGSTMSATVARGAVGRLGVGSDVSGLSMSAILTESRVATLASRSGLGGVLNELAASRLQPTLSGLGRVMIDGRPILRAGSDGSIRLWSSGQLIGQIRGERIFALDLTGVATTEIGVVESSLAPLADEVPLHVLRVRQNWYRLVLGAPSTVPPIELALFAAAVEQERKKIEQSGQEFPISLEGLVSQAEIGINDGEYMRALVYAARAVQLHPNSERAREMLTRIHRIRSILK